MDFYKKYKVYYSISVEFMHNSGRTNLSKFQLWKYQKPRYLGRLSKSEKKSIEKIILNSINQPEQYSLIVHYSYDSSREFLNTEESNSKRVLKFENI